MHILRKSCVRSAGTRADKSPDRTRNRSSKMGQRHRWITQRAMLRALILPGDGCARDARANTHDRELDGWPKLEGLCIRCLCVCVLFARPELHRARCVPRGVSIILYGPMSATNVVENRIGKKRRTIIIQTVFCIQKTITSEDNTLIDKRMFHYYALMLIECHGPILWRNRRWIRMRSHSFFLPAMILTKSEPLLRMNFRRTIASIRRSVQSFESREKLREAANDLTFTGKEAGLFSASPALFLRSARIYITCRHVYTHTQHAYSPIYRGGNLEIHGRLSTCRFLSILAMRVWCAVSFPPRGSLIVPNFFFFRYRFSPCCAPNFEPKKMALVSRGHWPGLEEASTAIGLSIFHTSETETSRAEPSRVDYSTTNIYSLSSTFCIVDLDGALTAVPFSWSSSSILEICIYSNQVGVLIYLRNLDTASPLRTGNHRGCCRLLASCDFPTWSFDRESLLPFAM